MTRPARSLALVLLFALVACGPGARDKALSATLLSVNAAAEGFATWDKLHQAAIVDAAPDFAAGTASLLQYRTKRETVVVGFTVAYRALALGAIDGKTPIPTVLQAAADALAAFDALKAEVGP